MARAELLEQGWSHCLPGSPYDAPCYSDVAGLGGGSSGRKRVFSPGFVVLCVFVAVVELIALNHFYVRLD